MTKFSHKILIAEDEDVIRRLFTFLLERHGFNVVTARDGREALQEYQKEKPDLLLSDVDMPNMNGYELLHKIRQKDKDLPTIFVTGNWEEEEEFTRDPYVEFMCKPVDSQMLCSRIERVLAS